MGEQHPNGPRNLATLIRDARALPREVIQRLIALDTNHPTLTDLRMALGLDLDIAPAISAGREAWPTTPSPTDEDLGRVLDAMYSSVASPRRVHVTIAGDGIEASSSGDTIHVRGGGAAIWLLVENRTSSPATSSAGGAIVRAPAGGTASTIIRIASFPPGSTSHRLNLTAGDRAAAVDLPIECHPAGTLRVNIVDDETGARMPARVYLRDDLGPVWPDGAVFRRDVHGNVFFHADGSFEASVCGTAHVRIARGIEYEAAELEVEVGASAEATVRCKRWSKMTAQNWYGGDVHVHLHYGGEYLLTPEDAALVQRAEDVHFMNMMVANQGSNWVHDRENFSGADHAMSDATHILRWGEEYRNNFYGHMCMFGINELVPPIHSGFPNSDSAHDLPSNAEAAAHCHAVGGALSYAHPMFASTDLDRVFSPDYRLSVEAKELPVDAALGHIDAVDVLAYPANARETCRLWYRLLNCGLRLAATAGTDTFMNFAQSWVFSNPPAGDRVFALVEDTFTTLAWCDAVRAGRTFVTNAPMLTLEVDGHAIGEAITVDRGASLRVEGSARSSVPMHEIELIVNGEIVASARATDGGREARITHDVRVDESCWIALRATGGVHEIVLHPEGVFAHTSPVYVTVGGAPIARPGDAAYFVEWIDRLIAVTEERARFPSDAERDRVVAIFRSGQDHYRAIAGGR